MWLRVTSLTGRGGGQPPVAEAWCMLFDGLAHRKFAARRTFPLADLEVVDDPPILGLGSFAMRTDPDQGLCRGEIASLSERVSFELVYRRVPGKLGDPLCMLPFHAMVDAGIPKNKLVSPAPVATFGGVVRWGEATWDLSGWPGMQGHNWGPEHAHGYAWGHCIFPGADGKPWAMVEAATGRVTIGPVTTPELSLMCVRVGEVEHRFDRIVDLWNQWPSIDYPRWTLKMIGPTARAWLAMDSKPAQNACLAYESPGGRLSHCLNSKLASAHLRLEPRVGDAVDLRSPHGGALEFLRDAPDPAAGPVT